MIALSTHVIGGMRHVSGFLFFLVFFFPALLLLLGNCRRKVKKKTDVECRTFDIVQSEGDDDNDT